MQLTIDDQWMMAYMHTRIQSWGDVRDDAGRAMKKIKTHEDFIDWADCFLTNKRKEEVKKALTAFKFAQARQKKTKPSKPVSRQVPVTLDEQAARILIARAKAARCSVSDFVMKKLA